MIGFPTGDVKNMSFDERIAAEGFNWRIISGTASVGFDNDIVNSTGSIISLNPVGQFNCTPGRMMSKIKINICSTTTVGTATPVTFQVQINEDYSVGGTYGKAEYIRFRLQDGVPQTLDLSQFNLHGNSTITMSIYNHPANTTVHLFGGLIACDLTDDVNYRSAKTELKVGDSITYGAAVGSFQTYSFSDIWTYKSRQYYIDNGFDLRMVNLSTHGINTSQIEAQRIQGRFNSQKWDLITYMAGTNDSSATYTGPQLTAAINALTANYTAFINWKNKHQPQAKLLFLGPPGILDVTRESQLVQFRTIGQNLIQTLGDSNCFFLSLAGAYTATNAGSYNGDGVHPNVASNLAMANLITAFLQANIPTI